MLIQPHWNNLNEQRFYPLDDSATGVDDNGNILPSDILIDLSLRWPKDLGRRAWISAVTVSNKIISIIFAAGNSTAESSIIAYFNAKKPIDEDRCYAISSLQPGVGGWVVLGSGANSNNNIAARFSTLEQSLLAAKAARAHRRINVYGLGHINFKKSLEGIIRLKTVPPLYATVEQHVINGSLKNVIVLQLSDLGESSETMAGVLPAEGSEQQNVFKKFAGPCSQRPESGTCPDPQPIEFINAVAPDCDGEIKLEFKGKVTAGRSTNPCGIVLDTDVSLEGVCPLPWIPDESGSLPIGLRFPNLSPPPFGNPYVPPPPSDTFEDSASETVSFPYLECFDNLSAPRFNILSGSFTFETVDPPTEFGCSHVNGALVANNRHTQNLIIHPLLYCNFNPVIIETWTTIAAGGIRNNSQLIFNYRPHGVLPDKFVYHLVELNADRQLVVLRYFNGNLFVTLFEDQCLGIIFNRWLRIEVRRTVEGDNLVIKYTIFNVNGDQFITRTVTLNNYRKFDGYVGLGSNKSIAKFGALKVIAL